VCSRIDLDANGVIDTDEAKRLLWGDYLVPGAEPRLYQEAVDLDSLTTLMTGYLEEHNAISTKPLRLVLFRFAIEHLSRISRVIKLPGGHTLLVGVGGSGRQSLTRLAAYMAEFEVMSIELSKGYGVPEWREDIKLLMMKAGAEGKPTVFLFNVDTQLADEHFLEDISNLLNTGQVPNLFPADERMAAVETVRARAKQLQASGRFHHMGKSIDTTDGAWELFLNSAKENLHIVLCLSPAGSNMRERLRSFPSLVNCCTIDWFTAWPAEALEAARRRFSRSTFPTHWGAQSRVGRRPAQGPSAPSDRISAPL